MIDTHPSDKFIKKIFHPKYHVVWICAIGVNQSGKTDLMLYIMERLHALGLAHGFGSNIPITANFHIDFIEDLETLIARCQMLNSNPSKDGIKRYFFFASEMGKWAAQDIPWKNTTLLRELQTVRKFGLSLLGDGIDRIDKRIFSKSHFHGYFEKESKDHPERATYTDWTRKGKPTHIKNIPRTSLEYDTFYSARFLEKPPNEMAVDIPLSPEHELVWKYLDNGESWSKAGIHRETGKRAMIRVLWHHRNICINHSLDEVKS